MMADSELKRTHPLTVAVRTAKTLGQGIAAFVAFVFFGALSDNQLAFAGIAAFVLLSTLIVAAYSWANWLFFRYGIVNDDLLIEEGWLIKKRRSIPLSRVQGVDIRASVMARILGLADVMVQTAGGGDAGAEARIGAIPLGDAELLRSQLIGHRSVDSPATQAAATAQDGAGTASDASDPIGHMSHLRGAFGGVAPIEAAPQFELRVPVSRLVIAGLTSNGPLIAVAAVLGLAGQFYEVIDATRIDQTTSALRALAIPALLALGLAAFAVVGGVAVALTIVRDYGFTIRRSGDRLETEAGLFERRMTSVPVRRIQAVLIESNPLRRLFRLASVTVNTAGFGQSEEQQAQGTSAALVPLAKRSEVRLLLHSLLWEAEQFAPVSGVPRRSLRFYLVLPVLTAALLVSAVVVAVLWLASRVFEPEAVTAVAPLASAISLILALGIVAGLRVLTWRAAGFGVDTDALVIQWGALGLHKVRIGRTRIQSLTVRQNPFQHRAGLATLTVASVSGAAKRAYSVRNLDASDASRIEAWYSPAPPAQKPELETSVSSS